MLEARDKVGGAVSSVERDGWVMDEFSACYPLAVASPVMSRLGLEDHGLEWCLSDVVVSHAGRPDDHTGATIHADVHETAGAFADDRREDGDAWLELVEQWHHVKEPFLDALLTRWPPVEAGSRLARAVGAADMRDWRGSSSCRRRGWPRCFAGQRGRMVLLGNAMHADIPPDAPGSGLFGWLMSMLAQDVGFPSPRGGAGMLAAALASRARAAGVEIRRASVSNRSTSCTAGPGSSGPWGARPSARGAPSSPIPAPRCSTRRALLSEHEVSPEAPTGAARLRLGPADGKDQLPDERHAAVDREGRAPCRGGARRRRRRRHRPLGGGPRHAYRAGEPVRAGRADDDGRPDPVPGGDRGACGSTRTCRAA